MKIEDIKPGDVIVRNNDEKLVKVAEVTSECRVMESAFYERDKAFCIFQKPRRLPLFSEDEYEPATEEQRQYMESKLAAFYGTNPEVESKRFAALATMMGDLKQENNELAERVKQLMDDYNRVVKQLQASHILSDLTEALNKLKQYDAAKTQLQEPSDKLKKAYEDYRALRDLNDTANKCIARFENSDLVKIGMLCPQDEKVKVSYCCSVCEHCMKEHLTLDEDYYLCAYKYDKKQEKEEELDNFRGKLNRELNS